MSGFIPVMLMVQPLPEPESPREREERELREERDREFVGGIPRQNLWKGSQQK